MQIAAGTPLSRRKERWQRHPARIYIFCATENAGGVMRSVSETVPCDSSMADDDTMGTEALSRHWLRRTLRRCLLNVFSTVRFGSMRAVEKKSRQNSKNNSCRDLQMRPVSFIKWTRHNDGLSSVLTDPLRRIAIELNTNLRRRDLRHSNPPLPC